MRTNRRSNDTLCVHKADSGGLGSRLHGRSHHQDRHSSIHGEQPTNLTGVIPVVTASGISGDNTATWTPTINIAVPGGMAAGVYTATITHSIV